MRNDAATVADCSERELVDRIQRRLPPSPPWVLVGIGDDAAVVEPERNRVEVMTVDTIVEGIHFDRAFVPPEAVGRRALAVNLSDLAAMGAAPRLALLSMVLPATLALAEFDAIAAGFATLGTTHRLHLVGGNLTRSPGPLMLDVTVVGTVKRRQALTRAGAKPGDDLYVSGTIGGAAAGLHMFRNIVSDARTDLGQQPPVTELTGDGLRLTTAYLFPEPRVRLGLLLSRNGAATACVDLSDGLADGVQRIAEASGVGVMLDADALPIEPAARAYFDALGLDAIDRALSGGDDYELLVASRPRARGRLTAAIRHGGVALTRIGRCTDTPGVTIRRSRASDAVSPLPAGFSHFR